MYISRKLHSGTTFYDTQVHVHVVKTLPIHISSDKIGQINQFTIFGTLFAHSCSLKQFTFNKIFDFC